ncbi:2-hydroxyacid dehydrogenase [Allorhizobium pseudoryzae]|jgi:glyoxylate/hydroxypyruvate reductase A|uniref:2-hydroxyacid dehydrogenase n=1 Tax=Allorhizobium pseudoryzae TaxID=379684 RepID=UPI003D01B487
MTLTTVLEAKPPHIALVSSTLDLNFLKNAFETSGLNVHLSLYPEDGFDAADVAVAWNPPHGLLATMPNLRLIHSIAAGLDNIFADPHLPRVPVCRVVDSQHALGMAEYAIWSVLLFHRMMDLHLQNAALRLWERPEQIAARDYTVGILGFGAIGRTVGRRLHALDYNVRAWARSPKQEAGIASFHGDDQLPDFLSGCDALICLLPLTDATRGILNADLFASLPRGAAVINMGRGEHLMEADLLAAIESGHLRGAVLDVFLQEPLPEDSPLWSHPKIFKTPHIASMPSVHEVVAQIFENATRVLTGRDPLNTGSRDSGY